MPRVVGLARSVCWLIAVIFAVAPTVAANLQELAPAAIQGSLKVGQPLHSTGALGADDQFFAVFQVEQTPDIPTPLESYFAEDVSYTVHETQPWYTVGTDEPGSVGERIITPVLPAPKLQPGRMKIVDLGDDSQFIVKSHKAGRLTLPEGTTCEIAPDLAEPVRIGRIEEKHPWPGSLSVLHAQCAAPRLLFEGPVSLRLEGPTVRLTGTDSTGDEHDRELCTGLCTTMKAPGVYEHTYRYIWIRPESDSRFEFALPSAVHLQAPALGVAGRLTVPPAEGTLRWAEFQADREVPALDLRGTFALGTPGAGHVTLEGTTLNRPMAATPGAVHTGDLGRRAGWGLAAAAGACLLASPLHPRLRWLLFTPLFSRLSEERAMAHPRRQQIVEAVRSNPGVKVQEVCRMLDLSRGVADHHVEVLCRQGVLVCRRFGRETGLFVKGAVDWELQPQVQRLRNETVRSLLHHVQNDPSITQTELAARLNVGQSYVCRVLKQLTQLGVLAVAEDGARRRAYQVVSTAANASWLSSAPSGGLVTVTPTAAPVPAEAAPAFAAMRQ